jgi:hypothetical protein
MSGAGKIRVVVNSTTVPARLVEVVRPVYSSSGIWLGNQSRTAVVYEKAFDDSQRNAIQEAKKLSCRFGLDLEVVDRARSSIVGRLVSTLEGLTR